MLFKELVHQPVKLTRAFTYNTPFLSFCVWGISDHLISFLIFILICVFFCCYLCLARSVNADFCNVYLSLLTISSYRLWQALLAALPASFLSSFSMEPQF